MNEYILISRKFTLPGISGAPNNVKTITLESGTPYRHYLAWVYVGESRNAVGVPVAPNINIQPKFGGENDGILINITSIGPTKIIQVPIEEIRPPTRSINKHPDDSSPPTILKSELIITNSHATLPVELTIYMTATATPGGA